MIQYEEILKANPIGVLATQEGRKVRTRVFQSLFVEGNKVYFCTGSYKHVYSQLQQNPNVSFCVYPKNYDPVVSIGGKAVFEERPEIKTKAFEASPMNENVFETASNPEFKVFYVDVEEVQTYSFRDGAKMFTV